MSPLKVYDVEVNGVKTQMKLDEEGAKRYGVWKGKTATETGTTGVKKAAAKKAVKKAAS